MRDIEIHNLFLLSFVENQKRIHSRAGLRELQMEDLKQPFSRFITYNVCSLQSHFLLTLFFFFKVLHFRWNSHTKELTIVTQQVVTTRR